MFYMLKYEIKDLSEFTDEELEKYFSYMCDSRKAKVKELKNEHLKRCTIAGEIIARKLLSDVSGKTPEYFIITIDCNRKPQIRNYEGLFFNISHSESKIAVAVSNEEIGIDIEVMRPYSLRLAKKICNEEELLYIFGHLPDETEFTENANKDTLHRFFEIWTAKEAYFKCIGTGLPSLRKMKALSLDFPKTKIKNAEYVLQIVKISDIT